MEFSSVTVRCGVCGTILGSTAFDAETGFIKFESALINPVRRRRASTKPTQSRRLETLRLTGPDAAVWAKSPFMIPCSKGDCKAKYSTTRITARVKFANTRGLASVKIHPPAAAKG